MADLNVTLNRDDGQSTIPFITAANLVCDGDELYIELTLSDDDEFAIYFKAAAGEVDEPLLVAARSLMLEISAIDNRVQQSCAAECKRTGLHPMNFEGALAYITLSRDSARLRYFGTAVNTEWDEIVKLQDGKWVYVGTAFADLSGRKG